MLIQSIWS